MTGISTDFQNNPRYQRAVQKLAAMNPEHRKSLNTAMLDKAFTTKDLRNKMYLADLGAQKLGSKRRLDLGKQSLGLSKDRLKTRKRLDKRATVERRKSRKFGERQSRIADIASGVGAIGSSWLGYQQQKQGKPKKAGLNSYYRERMAVK